MTSTIQKTQRFIVNFKNIGTLLLETLSGCPILPVFDVHMTPPFSGMYKLNVDATSPIGGIKVLSLLLVVDKSFRYYIQRLKKL